LSSASPIIQTQVQHKQIERYVQHVIPNGGFSNSTVVTGIHSHRNRAHGHP